jgi:thioesterase domain-containing protein
MGWQQHCSEPISIISVPGTHVSMMLKPNVAVLAARLGDFIDK